MKRFTLSAFLLATTIATHAGPFGLDMGAPLAEISKKTIVTPMPGLPGMYKASSVPKTHPDFDEYILVIAPGIGLCKVSAFSPIVKTSSYGTEFVTNFNAIEQALVSKYGARTSHHDVLLPGSIWNEPRDWMMGLQKKQRFLDSLWAGNERELPDGIGNILLSTTGISAEAGMISLTYEFTNFHLCRDWMKDQRNSSL